MLNRPEGPRYDAETQRAGSAAQQAGLGRPGQAFANTKLGFGWKEKDTGQLVYEFAGGLVSQQVGGRSEVFPWARITQVTRIGRHETKNGRYACTQFNYKVTRDDGAVMELKGSYVSPNRSSRADPESYGARFNKFGDFVAQRVSSMKLPGARGALARGETLTFGLIKINADGVVFKSGVVAWSQIREVQLRDGDLRIFQIDKRLALTGGPVSTIPNLPLFLTLVDEARMKTR